MKIIRRNHFYFIVLFSLLVIFITCGRRELLPKPRIINTISNDLSRRPIFGLPQSLMTPRRNQACLILNESTLVNIAGQQVHTIEFHDLRTGMIKGVYNQHLDIHRHVAVLHNGEIWLPCGLSGNNEIPLKHMLIINIETGNVRQGPRLRYPRSSCGAVIISQMIIDKEKIQSIANKQSKQINLNISKWTEDVICILGGSIGEHGTGNLTNHVECYSERARGWIVLPDLPVQLDHIVAHTYNRPFDNEVTVRAIPTKRREDQVLVVIGGRTEKDGDERQEIYTMSLSTGFWILAVEMIEKRSAFSSCISDNRYIIVVGGISYQRSKGSKPFVFSNIEICDLLIRRCDRSTVRLRTGRFDTAGCSTNELCYICGGTTHDTDNLGTCESFLLDDLLVA